MLKNNTRVFFIINPGAGKIRAQKLAEWIEREAAKRWRVFDVEIIGEQQSAAELARHKSQSFDLIVACGGDGTINHVVNGIALTGAKLGILPAGTGNDFIKTLALPYSLSGCMDLLFKEHTTAVDIIRYQGDAEGWCVNTLGIGLDGWANYYARFFKILPVNLKYMVGILCAYLVFRGAPIDIRIDGENISGQYLMITVCNGKWEGGRFKIAPNADPSDGTIELLTIKKQPLFRLLSYLPQLKTGLSSEMNGIQYYKCRKLEISSKEETAIHADGEHSGKFIRRLYISVEKQKLEVVTQG